MIIFIFLTPVPVCAATYYVDGSCDTSGNGTTAVCGTNGPWKTMGEAVSGVPDNDNHTISIAAGTYAENVEDLRSGVSPGYRHWLANGTVNILSFTMAGNYIKIQGFNLATSDGGNWNGTIDIEGDHDWAESCNINNTSRIGVYFKTSSSNSTANNITIYNAKSCGVRMVGTNNTLSNSDISHIEVGTLSDANGINIDADSGWTCTGHTVRGNYIHDIVVAEAGSVTHIDGIQSNYFGVYCTDVTIERNHIYLSEEARNTSIPTSCMMLSGAYNWTFKNNIFESWQGLETGASGTPQQLKFYNNLFRSDPAWTAPYWGWGIHLNGGSNHEVYNNIFINFDHGSRHAHLIGINAGATYLSDNNLFFNTDGQSPEFMIDGINYDFIQWKALEHDNLAVNSDPLFVTNYTDLHIQLTSPARDAGKPITSVTDDYDGISRPQGSALDIGPYEITQDSTPPSPPGNLRFAN